jgi:hypothetical protein
MSRVDSGRWSRGLRRTRAAVCAVLAAGLVGALAPSAAHAQVVLPPADPGALGPIFDVQRDGRLVVFTGFQIQVQRVRGGSAFRAIGTLPPAWRIPSWPQFALAHPSGSFTLLGTNPLPGEPAPAGANVFALPRTGGVARPIAAIPDLTGAAFYGSGALVNRRHLGETESSSTEYLSLASGAVQTVIANIPTRAGAVAADRSGNVFVGLAWHFDFETGEIRAGEIRRFSRRGVQRALSTGVPLEFERDGVHVAQVLTAESLVFDRQGDLWVGGGDEGWDTGYLFEINPRTGAALRLLDPDEPYRGDIGASTFYELGIDKGNPCRLLVRNIWYGSRNVYEVDACTSPTPRR